MHQNEHNFIAISGFGAALIKALYMYRLIFMTFHGSPTKKELIDDIHESPKAMTYPLILLATLSFFIFYTLPSVNPISDHGWFKDLVVPQDSFVQDSAILSAHEIEEGMHHAHYLAMALSLLVAGLGIGLSWMMYYRKILSADEWAKKTGPMYNLSLNKYYFDENYQKYLIQPVLKLADKVAYIDWDLYDKYFINGFGRVTDWISRITGRLDYEGIDQTLVDGVGRSAGKMGSGLKQIQTGKLQNYLLFVLAGVIVILVFQTI